MQVADKAQPQVLSAMNADSAVEDLLGFAAADVARFPTGYSLDDTCGMIGPGEMGLLWARSGAGKSTWLLNIVANSPKVPTVIFNMEMTARRQLEWLLSMTFDLRTAAREVEEVLRWGADDDRYDELVSSLRHMQQRYPALHFVSPDKAPSVSDLAMSIDDIEDQTGVRPQRAFIDHLSLLKGARDYDGVTQTAAALHQWGMKEGIALIVLQQTGRGGLDGGRNDGHLPVTLSSGIYAGEHDADWIWGLYRPEKDPYFKKQRWEFKGKDPEQQYMDMLRKKDEVKNLAKLQLIKNRPYGELRELGVDLYYDAHTRRLTEYGGK